MKKQAKINERFLPNAPKRKLRVYEDMRGSYILIRKPIFPKGTEFSVVETEDRIELIKIN